MCAEAKDGHEGRCTKSCAMPYVPISFLAEDNRHCVLEHTSQYHTARQQCAASGTKQLILVITTHDQDRLQGRPPAVDYLRRSAQLIFLGSCSPFMSPRLSDSGWSQDSGAQNLLGCGCGRSSDKERLGSDDP